MPVTTCLNCFADQPKPVYPVSVLESARRVLRNVAEWSFSERDNEDLATMARECADELTDEIKSLTGGKFDGPAKASVTVEFAAELLAHERERYQRLQEKTDREITNMAQRIGVAEHAAAILKWLESTGQFEWNFRDEFARYEAERDRESDVDSRRKMSV